MKVPHLDNVVVDDEDDVETGARDRVFVKPDHPGGNIRGD